MSKSHLVACPACARHIRVSEASCPFCSGPLDETFRSRPAPRPPASRLGRAALYALSATTVTMAAACSSSSNTGQGEKDSGVFMEDAAYGGPPQDGSADTMGNAHYGAPGLDSGLEPDTNPAPAYGAPVLDSGFGPDTSPTPAYGGPSLDSGSGQPDSMGGAPAYGAPPLDSGMGGALYGGPPQDI